MKHKSIKKPLFNILFLCVTLLFLSGCADKSNQETQKRLSVVAVNFYQYDFARSLCGNMADVKMIMRPGAEVHGYEPSLSDIIAIEDADVFIYNGGESDVWIEKILSSVDTSDMICVPLMEAEGITLYEEEKTVNSHKHDGDTHTHHEHYSAAYDEHIWTSPKNAKVIVKAIYDALLHADEKNSSVYNENFDKLNHELHSIHTELTDTVKNAGIKLIAVADRFPFLYLARDYGLEYMAAFSGCSPESDAGPSVIANMIEEIKQHNIKNIFYIELSNQKMADAICEQTGASKLLLHSCQSVSHEDFEAGLSYTHIMRNNIKNLKEALN